MSPLAHPPEVSLAVAVCDRAVRALVTLAEALGTPDNVRNALSSAEATLSEAQGTVQKLEEVLAESLESSGPLGDEDEEWLRRVGDVAEAAAREYEREQERLRKCQHWLRAGQSVAMGLMVLCAAVLSLDSARAALGVSEAGGLQLSLGAVGVFCEVALRGLGTSQRHLATVASEQRKMAQSLRDRARQVAIARATTQARKNAAKTINDVLGRLYDVTNALKELVTAVTEDMKGTPGQAWVQGFPNAVQALGFAVLALGTSGDGDEVARRLEVAQATLMGWR